MSGWLKYRFYALLVKLCCGYLPLIGFSSSLPLILWISLFLLAFLALLLWFGFFLVVGFLPCSYMKDKLGYWMHKLICNISKELSFLHDLVICSCLISFWALGSFSLNDSSDMLVLTLPRLIHFIYGWFKPCSTATELIYWSCTVAIRVFLWHCWHLFAVSHDLMIDELDYAF